MVVSDLSVYSSCSNSFLLTERTENRKVPVDPNLPLPTISQPRSSLGRAFSQRNPMKLYVGNLSYSVNDSTLKELFGSFGNVETARVISDRDTGQSKGFGFVEMADADAQKAMGALNGQEPGGRARRVNGARPQEPRTGGGGGGGSRGGYGGGGGGGYGRGRY